MWLLLNNTLNNNEKLIEAGKALCICQKFEWTCKDLMTWVSTAQFLSEKKFDFLSSQYLDYVAKLNNFFLGNSRNELLKIFEMKDDIVIETLKNAVNSRNFICHEMLRDLIKASFDEAKELASNKDLLKNHIVNIAKGDYLVSKWSYEFHEQIPGSFYNEENYVFRIVEWVGL